MTQVYYLIPHDMVYAFMMGGRAMVTFLNPQTGNQFTYNINRQKRSQNPESRGLVFWVQTRDDLIGYIRGDVFIEHYTDPTVRVRRSDAIRAFQVMWKHIVNQTIPAHVQIIHNGKCSYCGKPLNDSTSLLRGLGPECAKKLGISLAVQT